MATRTQDVYFAILDGDENRMSLYSDLTDEQIESIEGVDFMFRCSDTHVVVHLDPRYDPESIKADIRALAEPKPLRCTLGTVGVWTPVDTALPLSGVKVIVRGDFDAYWQCDYYVAERKFCFRGPNGARIEWLNDSMVINNVTHWTPIPPNE